MSKPCVPNAQLEAGSGCPVRLKHAKPFCASHVSELYHIELELKSERGKEEKAAHLPVSTITKNFWPPMMMGTIYSKSYCPPASGTVCALPPAVRRECSACALEALRDVRDTIGAAKGACGNRGASSATEDEGDTWRVVLYWADCIAPARQMQALRMR